MFNIYEDTNIYVLCPAYYKTGGTELAHQLVAEVNAQGGNAYITYYGNQPHNINPAFFRYVSEFKNIEEIEDDKKNIVVLPEIRPYELEHYKYIQKCVWWMSVDNYLKRYTLKGHLEYYGLLRTIKHILNKEFRHRSMCFAEEIVHLYQSEYAHQFLLKNRIKNSYRLSDYISDEYMKQNYLLNKKDIVLYNPKKGIKFTKKIIQNTPYLHWKPLINMSSEEVKMALLESKLYIDFGSHPGKDRFPREAAICGCCVITGKLGSAAYFEDVPIEPQYKFEDKEENMNAIIHKINDCIENFDPNYQMYENYREFIRCEHSLFKEDVRKLFLEGTT